MALLAVEGAVHHIASIGQRGGELAIEIGVVLDHEEAHLRFPSLPQSAASLCHWGSVENKTFFLGSGKPRGRSTMILFRPCPEFARVHRHGRSNPRGLLWRPPYASISFRSC